MTKHALAIRVISTRLDVGDLFGHIDQTKYYVLERLLDTIDALSAEAGVQAMIEGRSREIIGGEARQATMGHGDSATTWMDRAEQANPSRDEPDSATRLCAACEGKGERWQKGMNNGPVNCTVCGGYGFVNTQGGDTR